MRAFEGHRLQSSPLCLSVPLDGTERVRGLHALERSAVGSLPGPSPSPSPGRVARYKGPRLSALTLHDLKRPHRSWEEFSGWGAPCLDAAYNLPHDLDCLLDRAEENLVRWAPNYLRLALLVVMLTFYLRPPALLGAAALALSMLRAAALAGAADPTPGGHPAATDAVEGAAAQQAALAASQAQSGPGQQALTLLLAAGAWAVVAWTRCLPILALGAGLGTGTPRRALRQGLQAAARHCRSTLGRGRRQLALAARHWWSARRLSAVRA
ncbi:hypothetical protein F751_1019 [Auxenochlorella protothecoides]|uniref:PRA1 family protein n=1 Tax=Auxenochlorella protothecoides TaxID=3075 RepID=A0A087SC69_AUXPR|nr:hypothetical protein F751_1019 [Auxenochlorella protothecoides]KFM23323.1 hypothetical protein F751_1019 [Auxenochlorella protothecoides]